MSRTSTGPGRLILPTTRGTQNRIVLPVDTGGVVVVDAQKRGGEPIGIAFAAYLAVGNDVDAGAFHVADGEDGGVILRLLEIRLRNAPHFTQSHSRHDMLAQHFPVDEPIGLRVTSHDGCRQQCVRH